MPTINQLVRKSRDKQITRNKEPSLEESEKGYKNFTVVQNQIQRIDWLYLAASGHRRLKVTMQDKMPSYQWVIP